MSNRPWVWIIAVAFLMSSCSTWFGLAGAQRGMRGHSRPSGISAGTMSTDALFAASDSSHGVELWRYDGRSAVLVADINRGRNGKEPRLSSHPTQITRVAPGSRAAYFTARTAERGREVWFFDGKAATMVADVNPGPASSEPRELRILNGSLLFAGVGEDGKRRLWIYDGKLRMVVGASQPIVAPSSITVFGGRAYFAAADGNRDVELWTFDGRQATRLQLNPQGSAHPANFVLWKEQLWFVATSAANGRQIWKVGTDGRPVRVTNLKTTGTHAAPGLLTGGAEHMAFTAITPEKGVEMFLIDADGTNTRRISDFDLGGTIANITAVGDEFLFTVHSRGGDAIVGTQLQNIGTELWRVGSTGAPRLVHDINHGPASSSPRHLTPIEGGILFRANDGRRGEEPWIWERRSGRVRSLEIMTGLRIDVGGAGSLPSKFLPFGSGFIFAANGHAGRELYTFSKGEIRLAADIDPDPPLPLLRLQIELRDRCEKKQRYVMGLVTGANPGAPCRLIYSPRLREVPWVRPGYDGVLILESPYNEGGTVHIHADGSARTELEWGPLITGERSFEEGSAIGHRVGFQMEIDPTSPGQYTPQVYCTNGSGEIEEPETHAQAAVMPFDGCVDDTSKEYNVKIDHHVREPSPSPPIPKSAYMSVVQFHPDAPGSETGTRTIVSLTPPSEEPVYYRTIYGEGFIEMNGTVEFELPTAPGDPAGSLIEIWMFLDAPDSETLNGVVDPTIPPPRSTKVWRSYC